MNMMKKIDEKEYYKLYQLVIADVILQPRGKFFGISFIGSPGVGKSTVAKMLSEKLNIYVSINDQIRRVLALEGMDPFENQALVEKLAYDRTSYLLENQCSVIIDANVLTAYPQVIANFARFFTECFFIKLDCSEEEILRRLDARKLLFDSDNRVFSRATRKDYYKYLNRLHNNPFPEEKVFFTINTELNLEPQVDQLIEKIYHYFDN